MKKLNLIICGLFTLIASANATTWSKGKKKDPLTGKSVVSNEIRSYGTYIYRWPSKYDLVFWPLTSPAWICFNQENGYCAFNGDFEKLSEEEKTKLGEWLKKNYDPAKPPKTFKDKLDWMMKVYRQRDKNDDFWCRYYRLLAYTYRKEPEKSLIYVKKAIPLLQKKYKEKLSGVEKLEVLYLLGEYNRRLGNTKKAQSYFDQIKDVEYKTPKGEKKTGHPYFMELAKDRKKLIK